ncbi:MAG: Cna B domain protein, partial [Oscillospiraceae bacterium]|nr:Cna B domain protein [Oscillospiraceae bacterium]
GMNDEWRSVRFGLFADEQITAADGTFIPKDGLITTITLKDDMTATIAEKIPFGCYYVQEIASDEHYVLNGEKYLVTFEYMGQDVQTVNIDCGTFENNIKRGSVDGKKINSHGDPLENALFGLFQTGTEDYSIATAIMTDISDENGHFEFTEIPYGEYVVREITAPTGYILSDEIYPVQITEDGDAVEITAKNSEISAAVCKENIYGKELSGAQMQLVDVDGEIVDEWTSDGTNHVISEIPAGSYTLHEVAAPDGYVIATDIAFSIDEYGVVTIDGVTAEAHTEDGVPLITMVDDTTKVEISKQDATTGAEISGAVLQIIDKNGNVIDEWTSTSELHLIEAALTAGTSYTLKEITAPEGYEIAESVNFTVRDDGSITEVVMKDAPTPKPMTPTTPSVPNSPSTGDSGANPMAYVLIALGALGLAFIICRKKKED